MTGRRALGSAAGAALLAGAAAALAWGGSGGAVRAASAAGQPSVRDAVRLSKRLGPLPPRRDLHLVIALRGRNARELGRLLDAGQAVSPRAFSARFGPDPAAVRAALRAFAAAGLRVSWRPGETIAALDGPAAAVESLFRVSLSRYLAPGGRRFFAADRSPSIPAALRPVVIGVVGLENWTRGRHHAVPPGGLSPANTIAFYDIGPLRRAGLDGAGETIVLPEQFDPGSVSAIRQDLAAWAASYGLPPFDVTFRAQPEWGSVPASVARGALGEVALDLEVIHGIAPRAKLVVYLIAGDPNLWPRSEAAMVRDFPHAIISDSYGFPEALIPNRSVANVQQAPWVRAASQGMTHYVASGDLGAWDNGQDEPLTVDFPSALPVVTSVGGTSVFMSRGGGYLRELGWGNPLSEAGAGGGLSTFWPRPPWQRGPGVLQRFSNDHRQVPDVAGEADSSTGYALVFGGKHHQVGGTSAAAPLWAAITALIDQGLRSEGLRRVGFANPALYAIARSRPSAFHDVTGGNNLYYPAGPGWDFVTGWGTPDVTKLAAAWEAYIKSGGR